jgi:hypothetical protein
VSSLIFKLSLVLFCTQALALDFEGAIKQELSYLNLQYDSLQSQKLKLKKNSQEKQDSYEKKIKAAGLRLARLQAEIDELQFQVTSLERNHKGLTDRTMNLVELYNKAQVELKKTEADISFQLWKPSEVTSQSEVNMSQFHLVIDKIQDLLMRSSQNDLQQVQYLDESGTLKKGEVLRLGRVGALLLENDSQKILGPSPEGLLRIYESVTPLSQGSWQALLFQDLNAKINLKVQANLWDQMADLLPGLVLFLIFSLVLGLFSFMARE